MEQLNQLYHTEFTQRLVENKHIFDEIYTACNNTIDSNYRSYLIDEQTYEYCNRMYAKQELLYAKAKSATNVLEIGTYMAHSAFIMLLSNPALKITCIDISDTYAAPAIAVLNQYYPNAITFIKGDSLTTLATLTSSYDFFHMDGLNDVQHVRQEFDAIMTLQYKAFSIMKILFNDQINLVPLQQHIWQNYNIITHLIPHCERANVYFELEIRTQ